jgi:hypothetical protein
MSEREERLRMALKQESEHVTTSPQLRRRIDARLGRGGSSFRARALAVSVAVVLAVVGVAGWLITAREPVKESLQGEVVPDDQTADDALRCFINARHHRDLAMATPCMTQRYRDSISDPVEFIGPSSPSVERATIVSSARDGDRIVYDALVYWGSSTGLSFVSEDTFTVLIDGDEALVDSWTTGSQTPIGQTIAFSVWFLAPGDTPRCDGEQPASQSFAAVERAVPEEVVAEDQALSLARELVTGHWAHEADGDSVFANGTRVQRVTVAGGVATVELSVMPSAEGGCDFATEAMRRTLTAIEGIDDARLRQAPAQDVPSEPDV